MPASPLAELCLSGVRDLVTTTLSNIDQNFNRSPSNADLADECKSAVESLQTHLRTFIPPSLWATLLHIIEDEEITDSEYRDIRLIYSTFLFDNVYLLKFKVPPYPADSFDDRSLDDFWLQRISMLTHLVEVDLRDVNCEEIVRTVAEKCLKLQSIILPRVSLETAEFVISNIKNLMSIDCDLSASPEHGIKMTQSALSLLENLVHVDFKVDITVDMLTKMARVLKLKTLSFHLAVPEDIEVALHLCPDLQHLLLKLSGPHEASSARSIAVFEKLAASTIQLSKLTLCNLHIDSGAFEQFISTKGVNFTDLSIISCKVTKASTSFLLSLSKCVHLRKLSLDDLYGVLNPSIIPYSDNFLFPNLEQVFYRIMHCSSDHVMHVIRYHLMYWPKKSNVIIFTVGQHIVLPACKLLRQKFKVIGDMLGVDFTVSVVGGDVHVTFSRNA